MDYTSGPYSVTVPAGVTSFSFNISINNDNIFENNENFRLIISPLAPPGVMIGNPAQATVIIVNNNSGKLL